MLVLGRKNRSLVGLDIGSSAVKAVELRRSGDRCGLVAAGVETLPHETVIDGTIADGGAVSDAIRRLWNRLNFKTKNVAVSLSGHAVIVKKIALPSMPRMSFGAPFSGRRGSTFRSTATTSTLTIR